MTPRIRVAHVGKRFGGVQALSDVSLDVMRGEIHALVGENGAGKSTLGKIVAGVHAPDAGALAVDGAQVSFRSPLDALRRGITVIAQEISLVPGRTVIENVYLGMEDRRLGWVLRKRLEQRYEQLVAEVGFEIPGRAVVGELRIADQQKVEILRAVARRADVLVMDEPTASLTADETDKLLATVRMLRGRGATIVYVSHALPEVLSIADRVTVLRDGCLVATTPAAEETPESLVAKMLGRRLDLTFPPKRPVPSDAPTVMEVRGLATAGLLRDVSFDVRAGEILGIAGLVGSGRSETLRAVFGADARAAGEIRIDGEVVNPRSPRAAVRAGLALLPESRKTEGLLLGRSMVENVTLPHREHVSRGGWLSPRREARTVRPLIERLDIRGGGPAAPVMGLSGGNQQKVLFAKWLFRTPRVLLVDEPTRGVDVGAKRAIYELLQQLTSEGLAVVVVSSEIEEVIGLSHRLIVVRGGRIVSRLERQQITEEAVMKAGFGMHEAPGAPEAVA